MVQSYDLYILNLHFIQNLCYKKYFEFCRWFRCKVPLYILNLRFWCAPSEKRRTLITKYISNRNSVYQKILTFLNHHSPTSPSPAGLLFLLFSLLFLVLPRLSLVFGTFLTFLFFYLSSHGQMNTRGLISYLWRPLIGLGRKLVHLPLSGNP